VSWVWRFESADGRDLATPASPAHASQSDAESWLGETWRELAEAGVAQVVLQQDGEKVYGPMLLSDS
jgi:membrane-bound lytic murein transglycosylase B